MSKRPSERRNYKDEDMELNLTPMMNLITILIPALLVSIAFVELAVINVSAPAIGSTSEAEEKPKEDKPELNLTITITDKGFTLAGSGGVLPGETAGENTGPTFPVVQKTVSCATYGGTVPPPREKNMALGTCSVDEAKANSTKSFFVYDHTSLLKKLKELKEAFPDENRVIIAAEPGTSYEAITETMDSSRSYKGDDEKDVMLFDEVILSPGLS